MYRWEPISELERLSRQFDNLFTGPSGTVHEFPAVNVWSQDDTAILTSEIPGIDPDSLDISVVGQRVTISGQRQPEAPKESATYHRRERLHGQFARTLELPFRVDAQKVEANYSKGVLTVKLPRAEEDKPRKIAIKAA
jgi:HSP20 family protein